MAANFGRVKILSCQGGRRYEKDCIVLYRDCKILIARPELDRFNELFVLYAHKGSNGFNVVLPGESIGANLQDLTHKATVRY